MAENGAVAPPQAAAAPALPWFAKAVLWAAGPKAVPAADWMPPSPGRHESFSEWTPRAADALMRMSKRAGELATERSGDVGAAARSVLAAWPAWAGFGVEFALRRGRRLGAAGDALEPPFWGLGGLDDMREAEIMQRLIDSARADASKPWPPSHPPMAGRKLGAFANLCLAAASIVAATAGAPAALAAGLGFFAPRRRRSAMALLSRGLAQSAAGLGKAGSEAAAMEHWGDALRWIKAVDAGRSAAGAAGMVEAIACARRSSGDPAWSLGMVRDPKWAWSQGSVEAFGSVEEAQAYAAKKSEGSILESCIWAAIHSGGGQAKGLEAMASWRGAFAGEPPSGGAWALSCAELVAGKEASSAWLSWRVECGARRAERDGRKTDLVSDWTPKDMLADPLAAALGWLSRAEAFSKEQSWPLGMFAEVKKAVFSMAVGMVDWRDAIGAQAEADWASGMRGAASRMAPLADLAGVGAREFSAAAHEAVRASGMVGVADDEALREHQIQEGRWIFEQALAEHQASQIGMASRAPGPSSPSSARSRI